MVVNEEGVDVAYRQSPLAPSRLCFRNILAVFLSYYLSELDTKPSYKLQ